MHLIYRYIKDNTPFILLAFLFLAIFACKKDNHPPPKYYPPRKVVYRVIGTHIKLNFIDSNSVFQKGKLFQDSFRYEFRKAPGAAIGISIFQASPSDQIYYWELSIDDQLSANAYSAGGVYLTVPFQ